MKGCTVASKPTPPAAPAPPVPAPVPAPAPASATAPDCPAPLTATPTALDRLVCDPHAPIQLPSAQEISAIVPRAVATTLIAAGYNIRRSSRHDENRRKVSARYQPSPHHSFFDGCDRHDRNRGARP